MKLLYVAGEPGIGKTTAVAELLSRYGAPVQLEPIRGYAPARLIWPDNRPAGAQGSMGLPGHVVELGRRREGGFSGTDALPMAVIEDACTYLAGAANSEAPLVVAEGARLANRRFLTTAREVGWDVRLVVLQGDAAAARNRAARGSMQSESWLRGRRTATDNLRDLIGSLSGSHLHLGVVAVRETTTPAEVAASLAEVADLSPG